jgi:hypothetical protein
MYSNRFHVGAPMNPGHEMAAETEIDSTGGVLGFDPGLDGHPALEGFPHLLAKRAPESQTKRPASFVRYLVAICIGVVGTLAWQSYGEATKQAPATTASELGWSPDAKLAQWVQQLGWTKQSADLENAPLWLSTPEPPHPPVAQVITETLNDTAQRQQITLSLASLRQTVEEMAASQDKMAGEINKLAADVEMLSKIPAHPPQPRVAPARKPIPTPPSPPSRPH